ncbi:MAG: SDR family oxidoreductase [Myxococcota bacterium]
MTSIDLTGHRALVGGASRGIGAATAAVLAECGASVTLVARNEAALAQVCDSLARIGEAQHRYLVADYGNPDALGDMVRREGDDFSILIHNTGGPAGGALSEASPDALLAAFTQHLLSGQALVQAVVPGMRRGGYGRVVNVISTSVKEPIPGLGVSNTIRGAVASWSKTLAAELAGDGITVNNVLPGFTRTERLDYVFDRKSESSGLSVEQVAENARLTVPAGRFAEPSETAQAIAFLASPLAGYINGVNLPVDGGRTRSL